MKHFFFQSLFFIVDGSRASLITTFCTCGTIPKPPKKEPFFGRAVFFHSACFGVKRQLFNPTNLDLTRKNCTIPFKEKSEIFKCLFNHNWVKLWEREVLYAKFKLGYLWHYRGSTYVSSVYIMYHVIMYHVSLKYCVFIIMTALSTSIAYLGHSRKVEITSIRACPLARVPLVHMLSWWRSTCKIFHLALLTNIYRQLKLEVNRITSK